MSRVLLHKRAAMSLIELIAVIAVIAILATLLIPAVGKMTGKAYTTKCLSNLRQMYAASQAWSADNSGRVVPTFYPVDSLAHSRNNFTGLLAPYLGTNLDRDFVSTKDLPVATCPESPDRFGYGHNYAFLSFFQTNLAERWVTFDDAVNPSRTVFLTDSETASRPEGDFMSWRAYVRPPSSSLRDYVVSFRHPGNTANVLWLDGHVSSETADGDWMSTDNAYWNLQ